ncbi:hypothetical protein N7532_010116 [Penicillium argentinense]|uniref:U6 snRNA phosphodiesterase n=1 Tax=Penicillium argentinense TaxID=1131581 RepID=A0A9W9EP86_9EURO|nr:uncharacterized protein N7532_010116 [Penicillium argentinense]KAJ5085345.1 hypothetical protein N7532_010116 [Penicillium argentinense]
MSLVPYSSSSESESESESPPPTNPPAKKAKLSPGSSKHNKRDETRAPPLPPSFYDLYAHSTRVSTSDNPALHGGRKREIPHVAGNWPSHLYLEWVPGSEELRLLADLIEEARGCTPHSTSRDEAKGGVVSLLHSDLGVRQPLHISLSRTLSLRTEQKGPFMDTLARDIGRSSIHPFTVSPATLKWVPNYGKTRWFLVLSVSKPQGDNLNRLLKLCNSTVAVFGQPPLYATSKSGPDSRQSNSPEPDCEPQAAGNGGDFSQFFHLSIAWTLNEPDAQTCQRVSEIELKGVAGIGIQFLSIKAKIGNRVENIRLPVGVYKETEVIKL